MATFKTVPIDSTPARKVTTTLNNTIVKIRTYYNITDNGWFFDLFDVDDNPLVLGRAMTTGLELLFPFPEIDLGQLAYISTANDAGESKTDPGSTAFLVSRVE
jgi:hypothetical protein